MRRAYNRRQYLEKIAQLRQARPSMAFSTDMIVGFPGESEADFVETLQLVEEVQFDNIYTFKYSVRPGTEAAEAVDDVPLSVKDERLARLMALQSKFSKKKNELLVGTEQQVLVEGEDRLSRGRMTGHTDQFKIVNFAGEECSIGDIVRVQITQAYTNSLLGERGGESQCLSKCASQG